MNLVSRIACDRFGLIKSEWFFSLFSVLRLSDSVWSGLVDARTDSSLHYIRKSD